jgi:hypothetical protein
MKGENTVMNGAEKKKATPADKAVNAIIVLIILVFVAVGVYATYGKISEGVTNKEIESGKAEATVEAGQSVEDYLAQYGLTLGDTIKAKTTESEMLDNMTIENYAKYNGQEADSFLQGMSDSVTKDTVWKDLMAMPVSQVIDADALAQVKKQYQIGDDEISDSTTYEEFQKVLYQKASAASQAAQATDAPTAETTETPAE